MPRDGMHLRRIILFENRHNMLSTAPTTDHGPNDPNDPIDHIDPNEALANVKKEMDHLHLGYSKKRETTDTPMVVEVPKKNRPRVFH